MRTEVTAVETVRETPFLTSGEVAPGSADKAVTLFGLSVEGTTRTLSNVVFEAVFEMPVSGIGSRGIEVLSVFR